MADEYKFDFERWKREFPLAKSVEQSDRDRYWKPGHTHITSPVTS